jgi:hypothetical protein
VKFKELPLDVEFRFVPRKDAFASELIRAQLVYRKIGKRDYIPIMPKGTLWVDRGPLPVYSVGSINVLVEFNDESELVL